MAPLQVGVRRSLFDAIRPALGPLFGAYEASIGRTPFDKIPAELRPRLGRLVIMDMLRAFSAGQHYAIAGCIVLLGDNFTKACMNAASHSPSYRDQYGTFISQGVKFGAALKAGGNAFRHHEEWSARNPPHTGTARILTRLGILKPDASTCQRILEIGNVNNQSAFEAQLNRFCNDVP